ncbi:hypothetical protein VST7929_00117 [Vibrio stylophorae]|uniref:Class I SAM-dependent methyltransferase n=1 Tax=Vibrio stylophorae TaxID=659351 RepID=A0ABM8ZQ35_9VIBR|nr:class I SAM-dependent methyltransferase [Vibrio stylophorae]CAH0532301.1 hypothetical protein VST7929_00117 [Vibrio stylophorae]
MTHARLPQIPEHLMQPLWLRRCESFCQDSLLYDPIAAMVCQRCAYQPQCKQGKIQAQQQLLNVSLTWLGDRLVREFLQLHPQGRVINLGAGLDTRFFRLDNGRCQWIDLDCQAHLILRQQLFHRTERYSMLQGCIDSCDWIEGLAKEQKPTLVLAEHALLACSPSACEQLVLRLSRRFSHLELALVLAGSLSESRLAKHLGCTDYGHGFEDGKAQLQQWVPWAQWQGIYSPLAVPCPRWQRWRRWIKHWPAQMTQLTPSWYHFYF